MKRTLERWADAALRWSPVQPLFRQYAERRLAVLAYHDLQVPGQFERQMHFISRSMHPVSIEEVQAAIAGRHTLPRRAVLVTFDDGHRSVIETAMPILGARGIPAVVYIVAGLLDTEQPYWWEEARYLARYGGRVSVLPDGMSPKSLAWKLKDVPNARREAALDELRATATRAAPSTLQLRRTELPQLEAGGIAVGNHTFTHPCLNRCEAPERVKEEIVGAHAVLTQALGHEPTTFAYPNGNADARAADVLADLNYESGFLFDHRLSSVAGPDRFQISRLRVNGYTSMDRFRIILSGLHSAFLKVRNKVPSTRTENGHVQVQEKPRTGAPDVPAEHAQKVRPRTRATSDQRLKVLILIDSLQEGGAERSLVENLKYYRQNSINSLIVCVTEKKDANLNESAHLEGDDVQVLPRSSLDIGSNLFDSFLTHVRALRRVIATERPDLIHTTLPKASLVGRAAAVGTGVPVLSSLVNMRYSPMRFSDPSRKQWKTKVMQLIDGATARLLTTHFHAITHAVKDAAVQDLRLPPERITVIERGRDSERLGRPSAERRRCARRKLGLTETDQVLLNVGRQEFQKGQKYLVKAMSLLLRERPRLVLLVAGRRGQASSALDRLREQVGFENRIRFLGYREDVPELLAASDLFVFPSLFEGLGGAVLEAMALELSVVASNIAPMREVTRGGQSALLVEPGSPKALAAGIAALLDDPDRMCALGRQGREIFEERFTLEQNATRLSDLYFQIAGAQGLQG